MGSLTAVQDQLAAFLSQALHIDVPSPETDLFESGILDSLSLVQLLIHIEEVFGLRLAADDLAIDHFRSIAKISAFIHANVTTLVQ